MSEEKVNLRGISLSKATLEEKYQVSLTDTEWEIFTSHLLNNWNEDQNALRKLVFNNIRKSMECMDYKVRLKGKDLVFEKSE